VDVTGAKSPDKLSMFGWKDILLVNLKKASTKVTTHVFIFDKYLRPYHGAICFQ